MPTTKQRIILNARGLFSKYGIANTRLQQIADETGVFLYQETGTTPTSKSTFRHSNSKDAIGETQDIVIHPDGRVVCMRLTESMLPVMESLICNEQ